AAAACPTGDGRWPAPTMTFTLPPADASGNVYFPDVPATFPTIDWAHLERLYIRGCRYTTIELGSLPARTMDHPLVITNQGGQVVARTMRLEGGGGWVLSGRFDPVAQTGDAAFPGHRRGHFASAQGRYGIVIDGGAARDGQLTFAGPAAGF